MEISPTTNTASKTENLFSASGSQLGKDDFLELLVAQLGNQDPLDPLSNEDFIAQMATFSQLEQVTNLNTNITSFLDSQIQQNTAQAVAQYSSLIGKKVITKNNDSETVSGTVKSVYFENGNVSIDVDGKKVPAADIIQVSTNN
ncbi:flagellar hook assembly protein FlgD [bacterium]|nr:flagellar hook assembly protein FlgD [bacterium]MCP5463109.1 flagellar hook assembly protein FlgD [bacterium]